MAVSCVFVGSAGAGVVLHVFGAMQHYIARNFLYF